MISASRFTEANVMYCSSEKIKNVHTHAHSTDTKEKQTEQSKNMTLHKKNKCQQIEERYSWKNRNINTQNLSFPWVGGCVCVE